MTLLEAHAPVREVVRVFERDPELLNGVPPLAADRLRRVGAPALRADPGPWQPPPRDDPRHLGFLVVEGLLVRMVRFNDHGVPELVGAGDLVGPGAAAPAPLSLAAVQSWTVLEPLRAAELDGTFAERIGDAPAVGAQLVARAAGRVDRLAVHAAVAHVRSAELRVLLTLWHLADRWGRVTPDGVLLPLPLTHRLIAELACLRRPTTTSAVSRLTRAGRVGRTDPGHWILHGGPPDAQDSAKLPRSIWPQELSRRR